MGNILEIYCNWGSKWVKFKERINLDEIWKQIKNSLYEVSNLGRVRNKRTNHILRPAIDKYGYHKLSFRDIKGNIVYKTIHRLVAETWIDNKEKNFQVNHIDGNKLNNAIDNLEWVSVKTNIIHSFDNLLNTNTNHCILINLISNKIHKFRSIKDLARFLNIFPSTLMPLIKNSEKNPIYNKYSITILDEISMLTTSNIKNFGKEVWVYDLVNNQMKCYSSVNIAAYFTGIRCFSNLLKNNKEPDPFIGYLVSYKKELINTSIKVNISEVKKERQKYIDIPYKTNKINYYLYNYYSKEELLFSDISSIIDYLINIEPVNTNISPRNIYNSLGDGQKRNKTSLIKGFGIKSDNLNYPWFPYTEEIILCSKYGFKAPVRVYRLKTENRNELIFGIHRLCEVLSYCPDKPYDKITLDDVLKSSNIPNLSITRLNLPIS